MLRGLFIVMAASTVLSGCSDRNAALAYEELPDDAVMASVGDVTYAKLDLERDCLIMKDLLALARTDEADSMVAFDPAEYRRATVERFVDRELLVREANRRRIELSPGEIDDYQKRFAEGFAAKLPMNFRAIVESLGPRSAVFRANLKRDALACKMREIIRNEVVSRVRATPADAMRELAVTRRLNAETALTNAAICAAATNAWKSIRRGNDFDTVGRKLLEMRKDVAYEEDCVRTNAAYAKLAVGKLSPPMKEEGALVIAKALGPGLDGKPHFMTITFLLYDSFAEQALEDIQKELFNDGVEEGYEARLEDLRKNVKITICPCFGETNH